MNKAFEVGTWVQENIKLWKFLGLSNEQEVYLENLTPESNEADELQIVKQIRERFPEVPRIVFVQKPSLAQMQQMVEDLNKLLAETPKTDLLQIE